MKHPERYPKHDGDKGTVFGGVCNRTACSCGNAVWYNRMTYGYYCTSDARAINFREILCVLVDHELTMEEMNEAYREGMKEFQKN
jgi:hypothetical protein